MKRWIAALLALMLLTARAAGAEALMAELRNMRKSAGDRILQLESVPTLVPEVTPEPIATPEAHYEPLESGMKGDAVKAMQQRLIDLGYLSGGADGSYGKNTAAAVKAFQQDAGLEPTGTADGETLAALYSAAVPVRKQYGRLEYRRALEAPDACADTPVEFSGSVLQVLQSDEYADTLGIYTALRVATRGEFDDVAYVAWFRAPSDPVVSEGDRVTVRGVIRGVYSYANEAGASITLPRIEAEYVE